MAYSRQSQERRSVYNYASDSYQAPNETYIIRTRSVSREPSVPRTYYSFNGGRSNSVAGSSYRRRIPSIDQEYMDNSNRLETANKGYHDMHASFLSHRWENKHYLYGIQDTVTII